MKIARLRSWIAVVASVTAMGSCLPWNPNDRRLVQGETPAVYMNCSSAATKYELGRFDLGSNIGRPFPDLTLMTLEKETVRLSSFRGKRLALLHVGPCPTALAWMKELEAQHWKPPAGFDELLLLVTSPAYREIRSLVRDCPRAYIVGWPLEGYLGVVRWYPNLYEVGADGTFEGFQSYGEFKGEPREYLLGKEPAGTHAIGR